MKKVIYSLLSILFPLIYMMLYLQESSTGMIMLSLLLLGTGCTALFYNRSAALPLIVPGGLCLLSQISEIPALLHWYPVMVNVIVGIIFLVSYFGRQSIIERIATHQKGDALSTYERKYCRKVTLVWIAFFICNGSISFYSVVGGDILFWGIYNGFISYLLMGILFLGEWLVRMRVRKRSLIVSCMLPLSLMLCLSPAILEAQIPDSFEKLLVVMNEAGEKRRSFVQKRYVQGLTRPLLSEGYMKISPGESLEWQIREPVPATVLVTPGKIVEEVDGTRSERPVSRSQQELSRLLMVLHGGSSEDIEEIFNVSFNSSDEEFTLTLQPKQRQLRSYLPAISIRGRCWPEQVSLLFGNQDKLELVFPGPEATC